MTRPGRKTVELPESLYTALDQLAEERGMLTSELAAKWVWERLKTECPDLTDPSNPERVPDPIRYSTYPRRTKRQGLEAYREALGHKQGTDAAMEILGQRIRSEPDEQETSHMQQAYADRQAEHERFIANERGE